MIYQKVLKKIENDFNSSIKEQTVSGTNYVSKETSSAGSDMLQVTLNGYGLEDEPTPAIFTLSGTEDMSQIIFGGTIILIDDIAEEMLDTLSHVLAKINYYMPIGGYSIEPASRMLIYRYHIPVTAKNEKELEEKVTYLVGDTLQNGQRYSFIIKKLAREQISVDEGLQVLPDVEGTNGV